MQIQNIDNNWRMKIQGQDDYFPAIVPGSVCADLLNAGMIPDPYYRDNEEKVLPIMEHDFIYETEFDVDSDMLLQDQVILSFEGIDTIADIYLNGIMLGHVENMHRIWEFQVKEYLMYTKNKLQVILYSPMRYIRQAYAKHPLEGASECSKGFPHLRKAHCMFGWDWGIRLPDAGIWRDVKLQGYSGARFEGVYIRQRHEEETVTLDLEMDLQRISSTLR